VVEVWESVGKYDFSIFSHTSQQLLKNFLVREPHWKCGKERRKREEEKKEREKEGGGRKRERGKEL
jgi:hypothetical protein